MTRVLDIDLDIFVSPICAIRSDTRLKDDDCSVADLEVVRSFLENNCGLSADKLMPGDVFEEHDELFWKVKELVEEKRIQVPLELVHVDAHADMACGQSKPVEYLLRDLMHKPVAERLDPIKGGDGLNPGTIILFLAAADWLDRLTYVHHPDDGKDIPEFFLGYELGRDELENDPKYEDVNELPKFRELLENAPQTSKLFAHIPKLTAKNISIDPLYWAQTISANTDKGKRIPLELVSWQEFHKPGFDFVFMTRSPGFTPPAADAVFELLKSYVSV